MPQPLSLPICQSQHEFVEAAKVQHFFEIYKQKTNKFAYFKKKQ